MISGTAAVNGAELYYEIHGEDNDQTILTFHGGPGISDHQKAVTAFGPLAEEYRLVAYDHRGCGQSSLTPPYTNEQYADDAEALRRELDLGEVVIIGGSYGGFIAQAYAIKYGEHLSGLVLRDTAAHGGHRDRAREIARSRRERLATANLDVPALNWAAFERVMEGTVRSDEEFERTYLAMAPLYAPSLEEFDAAGARETVRNREFHHETHNAMFTHEHPEMDYRPELPEVAVPTLVTVGRNDWIVPVEYSEEIVNLIPNAELTVFEDSGHSPNLDQQEAYLARVREFLADIGVAPESR